ncbi:unnamed protein product [Lasius platythorax]|uniref:Uncharacterized protein n=1 Tax=Lasius platythorax TaxID=488582 RepID=A0AAV2NTD5_9HYME
MGRPRMGPGPQADMRVGKGTVVRVQVRRERIPRERLSSALALARKRQRGHLDVKDSINDISNETLRRRRKRK